MRLFQAYRVTATARAEDGLLDVVESPSGDPGRRGAELLVAAVAGGFAAEYAAAARRLELPVGPVEVEASAHLTARRDGRYGLVGVELEALVHTDGGDARAALAGDIARDRCVVAAVLDVPLSHSIRIAAPEAAVS